MYDRRVTDGVDQGGDTAPVVMNWQSNKLSNRENGRFPNPFLA